MNIFDRYGTQVMEESAKEIFRQSEEIDMAGSTEYS